MLLTLKIRKTRQGSSTYLSDTESKINVFINLDFKSKILPPKPPHLKQIKNIFMNWVKRMLCLQFFILFSNTFSFPLHS